MKHGTRGFGSALGALLLLASTGCPSLKGAAKEDFSTEFTCPEDRVQVLERKDLRASEKLFGMAASEPPEEVRADPARLTLWREREADRVRQANSNYTMFEANGCGHQAIYACARGVDTNGSDVASCSKTSR